ncbi:hypothetical protein C8F04DRAFT_1275782 [Mycena alexandri]|uniref:Cyclochlorotine biosynthesis protein O n=1 Tax=Mycena alexandri TaxID=1745969 RepID=A0AAD6S275_9AGAR|nr:hypothetical protein C8F04DRAFT_1275782 [Mycena alexandri]
MATAACFTHADIIMRDYTALPTDPGHSSEKQAPRPSWSPLYLLLLLSLLCNVFVCYWVLVVSKKPLIFPEAGYSPAQHMIVYQTVKFPRGLENDIPVYERAPSAKVDQAWEDLYAYAASRIPKSEAAKMTNTTWPILNEDGNYVIALDVFHQLHCLDMIRQQLHPGHNYTVVSKIHLRHCIGAIRQALMCYADTSPVVWQWSSRYKEAEQRDDILHTCRDFDRLQSWAKEHSMGLLPDLSVYIEG